ncbi:uncharacterized protein LOC130621593 [Hydractinia symbiolongicarpus]|uniref:uncharacterized protein LOC130621593 n=1 Tax=Hydractinia symbiolongicarpus TaxID=13093 RepID=UPI002550E43A|nr:uncharacterized protein LOC130621593 [Hydractinia symbiolongicarpus]
MKYYFAIIITVLVVIISLLFLILYKIYRLHVKSTEELDLYEQQELLSTVSGSKESTDLSSFSEHKDFLNNDVVDCRSVDLLDGINGKQEVDVTQVQPDVKELAGSNNSLDLKPILPKHQSLKNRPHLKLLLQYDKNRSVLKVIIKHLDGKLRSKLNSSESYVDIQVSAYRFRTYRNPGYRRPARAVLKKQVEFRLDFVELRSSYLLIFLLRYDPFSRLKVDGEVVFKLMDIISEGFLDGCQIELSKEIVKSNQDFTAFIFRPS